jgi:hypothetical protein
MHTPIEPSTELNEMRPSPEELEAIRLRWSATGGVGDRIEASDAVRLLHEIRERQAAILEEARQMFLTRIREGRWYPRRHQQFAVLAVAALLLVAFVVGYVISLF